MIRIFYSFNSQFLKPWVFTFSFKLWMLHLFWFLNNIFTFLIFFIVLYFSFCNDQFYLQYKKSQYKISVHWYAKLTVELMESEWIIPRPSQVVVIFLITYSFVTSNTSYLLYLGHLQHISRDQVKQFPCISLSSMIVK